MPQDPNLFSKCTFNADRGTLSFELSPEARALAAKQVFAILVDLIEQVEALAPEPELVDPMDVTPGPLPDRASSAEISLSADDVYACAPEHLRGFVDGVMHVWLQEYEEVPGAWYRVVYEDASLASR